MLVFKLLATLSAIATMAVAAPAEAVDFDLAARRPGMCPNKNLQGYIDKCKAGCGGDDQCNKDCKKKHCCAVNVRSTSSSLPETIS